MNFAAPGAIEYDLHSDYVCIPFVVRYAHPSATRTIKDFLDSYDENGKVNPSLSPDLVLFDEDDYDEDDELPCFSFAEEGLRDRIEKDFSTMPGVIPGVYCGWITTDDIDEFVDEMEQLMLVKED